MRAGGMVGCGDYRVCGPSVLELQYRQRRRILPPAEHEAVPGSGGRGALSVCRDCDHRGPSGEPARRPVVGEPQVATDFAGDSAGMNQGDRKLGGLTACALSGRGQRRRCGWAAGRDRRRRGRRRRPAGGPAGCDGNQRGSSENPEHRPAMHLRFLPSLAVKQRPRGGGHALMTPGTAKRPAPSQCPHAGRTAPVMAPAAAVRPGWCPAVPPARRNGGWWVACAVPDLTPTSCRRGRERLRLTWVRRQAGGTAGTVAGGAVSCWQGW